MRRRISRFLAVGLSCLLFLIACLPAAYAVEGARTYDTANYHVTKISNPTTGSGEPDGILLGDEANRINSYAWATAYRDGYLYIGVNRNFLQVAVNNFVPIGSETLNRFTTLFSHGEIPDFSEEQRQPQIIKLDPATGETEVIYEPPYVEEWGYYRDAAYRHVIDYKGDLYFGTFSGSSARILKVDQNDQVTEVFDGGGNSSYRTGCIYKDELYYAGLDDRITGNIAPDGSAYTKMAIIRMEGDEWNRVADYKDFIAYAQDTIYQGEGGNMWDIIEYNGYLYAIIAVSDGFVMFRGLESPEDPAANEYGWVWQEVIGKNSEYHMGLAPTAEGYPYEGAVASSATPVVYQGKLYLGTFDYATRSMAAFVRQLAPIIAGTGDSVKLSQLLAPLYASVTHPQKLYAMDENENITEVTAFNELLEGTSNEYIWRFQEHNGKMYIGTFDAETMYKYLTQITDGFLATMDSEELMTIIGALLPLLSGGGEEAEALADAASDELTPENAETMVKSAEALQEQVDAVEDEAQQEEADGLLQKILSVLDMQGVEMYLEIAKLLADNPAGFDMYVTSDMENFEKITDNGFNDPYNYGARTFVSAEEGLYIGTANPFYGAQVWLLEDAAPGENVQLPASAGLNLSDGTVGLLLPGTKAGILKTALQSSDVLDLAITNSAGEGKADGAVLMTGDVVKTTVRITFTEFNVSEYTVAVAGDLDADGVCDTSDARLALRIACLLEDADSAVRRAANLDQKGDVTSADARLILRVAVGLDKLSELL